MGQDLQTCRVMCFPDLGMLMDQLVHSFVHVCSHMASRKLERRIPVLIQTGFLAACKPCQQIPQSLPTLGSRGLRHGLPLRTILVWYWHGQRLPKLVATSLSVVYLSCMLANAPLLVVAHGSAAPIVQQNLFAFTPLLNI